MKSRLDFFLYRVLFLLMGASGAFLLSPFGRIQSVQVSGNDQITSESLVQHLALTNRMNLVDVWLSRKHLEEMAKQASPQILNAKIRLRPQGKLYLSVEEAKPLALWKRGKRSFYVLKNGQFLPGPASNNNRVLPLIRSDMAVEDVTDVLKDLDGLNDEIRQEIGVIRFSKNRKNKVYLMMNDGQQVVGKPQDIFKKMAYYKQMKTAIGDRVGWLNLEEGAYFKADKGKTWQSLEPDDTKNTLGQ